MSSTNSTIGSDAARSRFFLNVGANLIYILISTAVMFWYVPFLIRNLGVSAYGLVPLVTALVSYAALLADSLNLTVLRFLAIDINRNDTATANRTFNTALALSLIFSLGILPILALVAWFFPHLFEVPPGLEIESRLLFAGAAIALLITLVASNFNVSTLILHRFDLRNLILGLSLLTRVGIVVLAFQFLGPNPWQIGLAFVAAALVSLLGGCLVWRRLTPQLGIRWFRVDREQLRAMSTLGGWAVVVKVGFLLFFGTDLIVVNIVFGPEMSGRYGALLLFAEFVRNLAQSGASVLSPTMIARYAKEEGSALRSLAARGVKLMGLAVALPIGLICGFAEPLLGAWLGEGFVPFAPLLVAIMAPLVVSSAVLPLAYVLTSHNRIRLQGITTLGLGIVNVALAVAVARWSGLGPIGVALVSFVGITTNNLLIASYCARVMKLPWQAFYPSLLNGMLHAIVVALVGYGLTQLWWPSGWITLGLQAAGLGCLYMLGVYFISFNADDRGFVIRLVPASMRRRFGKSRD